MSNKLYVASALLIRNQTNKIVCKNLLCNTFCKTESEAIGELTREILNQYHDFSLSNIEIQEITREFFDSGTTPAESGEE